MTSAPHQVTKLLQEWSDSGASTFDKLWPLVYDELHRLAHEQMRREKPGNLLQTSALINEAYLRPVDDRRVRWQDRAHCPTNAARVMRQILIDEARKRNSAKRGADMIQVSLTDAANVAGCFDVSNQRERARGNFAPKV